MEKLKKPIRELSDKRDEAVLRKLDLKRVRPKRGKFMVIQLDSLPHSILKRFLDRGSCRFIRKLLDKEGYHLQRFNCGLPSGTPSVQASVMYGDNSMIPGFRFVDKKSKRSISFGNPNDAKYIESRFFSKKRGILEGGASYSNMYSGGAERSILTMSTMTKSKHFRRIRESSLWLFLFLHPASALRILYYTAAEMIIELFSIMSHPLMRLFGRKAAIFGFRIPIRRFLMNVILAEIITVGTILDLKRGVPKIYTNYMNFDDVAHLRGPNSTGAYFMVRALDRRIKRICRKMDGDYDLFILSDHGQVDGVPFRFLEGMTIAQYIERCANVESFGLTSAHEGRLSMIGVVMRKTLAFVKYVSSPLRWIVSAFAKGMLRVLRPRRYRFVWDDRERIFVTDSCSMAHVYFNISDERLSLKRIEKRYPKLVGKLAGNRNIGIVMGRQGGGIVLMCGRSRITIGRDSVRVKGRNFLKRYGDFDTLVKQFRDFERMRFVGDLVLFGDYRDGVAVSFADHVGAHGGVGGDMNLPFFISKKKYDLSGTTDAGGLHRIFREY